MDAKQVFHDPLDHTHCDFAQQRMQLDQLTPNTVESGVRIILGE